MTAGFGAGFGPAPDRRPSTLLMDRATTVASLAANDAHDDHDLDDDQARISASIAAADSTVVARSTEPGLRPVATASVPISTYASPPRRATMS